ncbi:hypothetical protein EVG20_g3103 [Dentipellis fragilis]|uniref:Uncharacterized protein n=1 Tax=Dentipellis fragilis TaxID=205917 RepID=A0A4Y9Z6Y6_9AGAM|nr:hypothetical protein EVG20_g3103 [Dentipellis fragilis]
MISTIVHWTGGSLRPGGHPGYRNAAGVRTDRVSANKELGRELALGLAACAAPCSPLLTADARRRANVDSYHPVTPSGTRPPPGRDVSGLDLPMEHGSSGWKLGMEIEVRGQ